MKNARNNAINAIGIPIILMGIPCDSFIMTLSFTGTWAILGSSRTLGSGTGSVIELSTTLSVV